MTSFSLLFVLTDAQLCVSYFAFFLFLHPSLCLCLPISPCLRLHVCTFCAALIRSVWFHPVAALCLLHSIYACLSSAWIICQIMHILMSGYIKTTEEISVHAYVCMWVSCVSCSVVLHMWVAEVECWSKQCIDCLCAAGGTILAHDTKTHTASLWPVGHKP